MKSRSFWTGMASAAGMLVLILDSRTAMDGMRSGIDLCLRTLIPSLFPFFILSILMTGSLLGQTSRFLRPIGRLCGIPEGAESLFLTGLLGGYPVGAQNVALAYEAGALSKADAQRLIGFCSNAGPAFLFGIVGQAFDSLWLPWALWGIHIVSAAMVGIISRPRERSRVVLPQGKPITLTQALRKAITVMAQVSGWVVLFRMLLNYLNRWFLWLLPGEAQILITGILELSNGCVQLRGLEREGLRLIGASGLLALGGVCVALQTASVTKGLSLGFYFPGKLLQASLGVLMAWFLQLCLPVDQRCGLPAAFPAVICAVSLGLSLFLQKRQNNSSIPASIGV